MTDRNAAAMGKSVKEDPAKGDDGKAKNRDKSSNSAATGNHKTPTKKRRKVNHGTPNLECCCFNLSCPLSYAHATKPAPSFGWLGVAALVVHCR
jgi:hypothetical protein